MEGVGSGTGQRIEAAVDVSQPAAGLVPAGYQVLVEQRQDAREGWRAGRRAADDSHPSDRTVGSVDEVPIVGRRSGKSHVGHVPRAVVGHPRAGLPGRFGEELAGAAAAGCRTTVCRTVVPCHFGDVRQRRALGVAVRTFPIGSAAFHKSGAAHGGNFRNAGRQIDGQSQTVTGRAEGAAGRLVTSRRAGIA